MRVAGGNVHKREFGDRARKIVDRIEFAGEIVPVLDRDYAVKNWFDRGAVSCVYGSPSAGKTFWAVDLARHVSEGLDWAGCRVRRGPVLYIAAEGGALFGNRLAACRARFMVLRGRVTLAGNAAEGPVLAEAVQHLAVQHGPFSLIVIDTLSRAMADLDENAAPAIASLMRSVDHLKDTTGAHVMLIHHIGKDETKGARGHSSLLGAVDTEVRITVDKETGLRTARAVKQRDLPDGLEHRFRLESVTLAQDTDGDPVTTCIVRTEGGR